MLGKLSLAQQMSTSLFKTHTSLQLVMARCPFALDEVLLMGNLIGTDRSAHRRFKGLPAALLKDSGSLSTS